MLQINTDPMKSQMGYLDVVGKIFFFFLLLRLEIIFMINLYRKLCMLTRQSKKEEKGHKYTWNSCDFLCHFQFSVGDFLLPDLLLIYFLRTC